MLFSKSISLYNFYNFTVSSCTSSLSTIWLFLNEDITTQQMFALFFVTVKSLQEQSRRRSLVLLEDPVVILTGQSGSYESSACLNNPPVQLQHHTSAPQLKNNMMCSWKMCVSREGRSLNMPSDMLHLHKKHFSLSDAVTWCGGMHISILNTKVALLVWLELLFHYCWSSGSIFIRPLRLIFKSDWKITFYIFFLQIKDWTRLTASWLYASEN